MRACIEADILFFEDLATFEPWLSHDCKPQARNMVLDIAQIGDPVLRDIAPEVSDLVEDPLTMYTWQEFHKHHEEGIREQVEQLVTRYGR